MPRLDVFCEHGPEVWPDLPSRFAVGQVIDLAGENAPPMGVCRLGGGMASGKASVTFRFEIPDGRTVLITTSLDLLETAVRAFRAYESGQAERG